MYRQAAKRRSGSRPMVARPERTCCNYTTTYVKKKKRLEILETYHLPNNGIDRGPQKTTAFAPDLCNARCNESDD